MPEELAASIPDSMRALARDIFLHALAEANIETAFDRDVAYEGGVLRVCQDLYDLHARSRIFVVSFGKAGHTMAEALARRFGTGLQGIVSCPVDPPTFVPGFTYYRGGHPLPNQESLRAANAILRTLSHLNEDAFVLFLLSGGGSSLLEKPIDDDISLDDLVAMYRALVHSGAPIAEINAIRKHVSALKGGRLARAAECAQQVSIMVSDVPEDAIDSLASGPTVPDTSTVDDCYRLVQRYELLPQFPASVRNLFEHHALDETPKSGDAAFARSRWWTVLSNATAVKAAREKATSAGFTVEVDNSCDDWDYAAAADYLLDRLHRLRQRAPRACIISGGEVTVRVTGQPGMGGRNQQFALYCAGKIAGENIAVISAGTDGADGNSSAAGAVVDGTTFGRSLARNIDPADALARFDTFPLFELLSDAIITGPTGNNVRDLRILLAW
jgi:hydroxypyruvate reductase